MTIAYGQGTDVEQELTARLSELVHAFIADLHAQGRLVESGGADTLRRLRQQNRTQHPVPQAEHPLPQTEPGDAEVTETAGQRAPGAPALWELITAPRSGQDTPRVPQAPRPLRILGVSETPPTGASVPDSFDAPAAPAATPAPAEAPAPGPAQQAAALAAVTGQSAGAEEPRTADGDQTQPAAAVTAARLRAENAGRLEVTQITSDHERVTVHIHALSLYDWEYWLTAIGAPLNAPTHRSGWVQTATGHLDGVEVRLTADAVPRLLEEAAHRATEPYCLGGRVYDLALGHTDRLGQTWHYHGGRQEDDTPLFTLGGTSGPSYPLTSIVISNGPLTPAPAHPDNLGTR
ncbi:BN159_2729 family protein [Streptomyces sp. NPDC004393]|uniref:BN159_2729 family protein n=2 Tax=unclassified Streptomyces TaxID=2593676 RepID=UPI0033B07A7B